MNYKTLAVVFFCIAQLLLLCALEAATPTIQVNAPSTVREEDLARLAVIADDPDGHPLTISWTIPSDPTGNAAFYFSDGGTAQVVEGENQVRVGVPRGPNYPSPSYEGQIISARVEVSDGVESVFHTYNLTVTGVNLEPVVVVDTSQLGTFDSPRLTGQGFGVNSSASSDPDGDQVKIFWRITGTAAGFACGAPIVLIGPETQNPGLVVPPVTATPSNPMLVFLQYIVEDGLIHQTGEFTGFLASLTSCNLGTAPDLAVSKTHTGDFRVGQQGVYTITVRNAGTSATSGTITVTDQLPGGLSFISGTGSGWTCAAQDEIVNCTSNVQIAASEQSSFTLNVNVASAAVPSVTNIVTVVLPGDGNPQNNTAGDTTNVQDPTNTLPVANAGDDQIVAGRDTVVLMGSGTDANGDVLTFMWSQSMGPSVELTTTDSAETHFTAPRVTSETRLAFLLTVRDGRGGVATDEVSLTVRPFSPMPLVFPVSLNGDSPATTPGRQALQNSFVGIALANPSSVATDAMASTRDENGNEVDEVELPEIAARGQIAFLTRDEVGAAAASLVAEGSQRPLQGFFLAGNDDLRRLDGVGGELRESREFYFPNARQSQDVSTTVFLYNSTTTDAQAVQLSFLNSQGEVEQDTTISVAGRGSMQSDLAQLFSTDDELENGYLKIVSDVPLRGFELFADAETFSALTAQQPRFTSRLVAPHFFVGPRGSSELTLLNPDDEAVTVNVTGIGDTSETLGTTEIDLAAGEMFTGDLQQLLDLSIDDLGPLDNISGYLNITFSGDGDGQSRVLGAVSFNGNNGTFRSTLPLIAEGSRETLVLQVAQSTPSRIFTGLAILNGGTIEADVTVEVFDRAGELTATRSFTLDPGRRVVDLLNGNFYFGEGFEQEGGHIQITGSRRLVVFALFGDFNLGYLSAIEAQFPVPFDEPEEIPAVETVCDMPGNQPAVATVPAGVNVMQQSSTTIQALSGRDPDNTTVFVGGQFLSGVNYQWSVVDGAGVLSSANLSGQTTSFLTVNAPAVNADTQTVLTLTITDAAGCGTRYRVDLNILR